MSRAVLHTGRAALAASALLVAALALAVAFAVPQAASAEEAPESFLVTVGADGTVEGGLDGLLSIENAQPGESVTRALVVQNDSGCYQKLGLSVSPDAGELASYLQVKIFSADGEALAEGSVDGFAKDGICTLGAGETALSVELSLGLDAPDSVQGQSVSLSATLALVEGDVIEEPAADAPVEAAADTSAASVAKKTVAAGSPTTGEAALAAVALAVLVAAALVFAAAARKRGKGDRTA